MKSSEITEPGFYWWSCPEDEGPDHLHSIHEGRPPAIVQIGAEGFNIFPATEAGRVRDCFMAGSPTTYVTSSLPGDFIGPIVNPWSVYPEWT